MVRPQGAIVECRALAALAVLNARYWTTVLPRVNRGLRHWQGLASEIPDPKLRDIALHKVTHERFNVEVTATAATLAPRRYRALATDAIVSLQVIYDYLDGLSEEPVPDPLDINRRLFAAFRTSLTPGDVEPVDYYGNRPHRDDGGYLESLVAACRRAFGALPGAEVVAPIAREAARRCGEAQVRGHASGALGVDQLSEWATAPAREAGLEWWEFVAAAMSSILSVHILIATAGDARVTRATAEEIDAAYLVTAALTTLLDSAIDHNRDVEDGSHSLVGYYEDEAAMVQRIGAIAAQAGSIERLIPGGGHRRMFTAGVAAYFLSDPAAEEPPCDAVKARVVAELRPLVLAALAMFRLWRMAKAVAR